MQDVNDPEEPEPPEEPHSPASSGGFNLAMELAVEAEADAFDGELDLELKPRTSRVKRRQVSCRLGHSCACC